VRCHSGVPVMRLRLPATGYRLPATGYRPTWLDRQAPGADNSSKEMKVLSPTNNLGFRTRSRCVTLSSRLMGIP
jgi:hypothetical protein